MAYREEEKKVEKRDRRIYSDSELQAIDKELMTKYLKSEELSNGEIVHIIDYKKYHVDKGSMTPEGAVIMFYDEFNEPLEPKYVLVEDRLHQWNQWKGKKEFQIKKTIENLQKIAEEMTIKKDY